MSSRRNILIRTVATLCGDIAVGVALASACVWLIETAMLGIFLSFMAWLLAAILSLAISQYVIHPLGAALLSDRKLDDAMHLLSTYANSGKPMAMAAMAELSRHARSAFATIGIWRRPRPVA